MNELDKEIIIDELLSRSVDKILPSKEELKNVLLSDKKLRIYIGADATGKALHLGHATNFIILEKFRKLGHKVIILIGDFTARIGDPTDKSASRTQLSREQVIDNVSTWLEQLKPFIDLESQDNPVEVVYNNDWFAKMTFEEVLNISSNFTVQRMLERDMFDKRIKENKPIFLHEFFYPMMQGWDSVHLDIDIEICGTDQTFNALAGRQLQKKYNNKDKFVFITTLLENPITKEKMMSKSLGTGLFLDEDNISVFGKIMSQADENIEQIFIDCSFLSLDEIKEIINEDINPMTKKLRLAFEITKIIHGEEKAQEAREYFARTVQNKEIPEIIDELEINLDNYDIISLLLITELVSSKSEARRLIIQNGIKINGEVVSEDYKINKLKEFILQKGKRQFIKIKDISS